MSIINKLYKISLLFSIVVSINFHKALYSSAFASGFAGGFTGANVGNYFWGWGSPYMGFHPFSYYAPYFSYYPYYRRYNQSYTTARYTQYPYRQPFANQCTPHSRPCLPRRHRYCQR